MSITPYHHPIKPRWHYLITIAFSLFALASLAARADVISPVPPAKALQLLLDGNQRFVSNRTEHPNQRPSDSPQHPLAVVLSCSDSRVPPEIIFDQGVGNLFIVRVAGNTYDRLALESIEYAVGHLGTTLIMVIGHDQCGAVTAALKAYPDPHAGPMVANIYPAVREARGQHGDELSNAIDDNAVLTASKLEHEPGLTEEVKSGQLQIQPARYILKTGAVELLKPKP
jgi:carbonic anhydrase